MRPLARRLALLLMLLAAPSAWAEPEPAANLLRNGEFRAKLDRLDLHR